VGGTNDEETHGVPKVGLAGVRVVADCIITRSPNGAGPFRNIKLINHKWQVICQG
jgi:hypothetical protein